MGSISSSEITPKSFDIIISIMVKIGTETVPIEIPNKTEKRRKLPASK
jgi:hypothetical protein